MDSGRLKKWNTSFSYRFIMVETRMLPDYAGIAPTPSRWRHGCSRRLPGLSRYLTAFPVSPGCFKHFKAPFSLSRFKVPVHPGLMIRDEPCHNRGGTVDNLGDPG